MSKNIDYEKIEQRAKVKQGIVKTLTYALLTFWGIVVLVFLAGLLLLRRIWRKYLH